MLMCVVWGEAGVDLYDEHGMFVLEFLAVDQKGESQI